MRANSCRRRAAARMKPVIAIKTGRTGAAAHAATSHTGALAGMGIWFMTQPLRAGILRAFDLDEILMPWKHARPFARAFRVTALPS